MIDPATASVIIPTLATEWPKLVSVILIFASGYIYAHHHYAPIIQDLKNKINSLQWQVHDLKNERDALKTKLELTQVSPDTAQPVASGTTSPTCTTSSNGY